MNIVILNGSPRPKGNTAAMVAAYREGAESAGHTITVFDVCRMRIAGCLACEHCHNRENRVCVQNDDMQQIYPALDAAGMLVLAPRVLPRPVGPAQVRHRPHLRAWLPAPRHPQRKR